MRILYLMGTRREPELSVIAGVGLTLDPADAPDHGIPNGSVSDRRLMPVALCYDLALFETTPKGVLCASAMNGFDKAVKCLYSPYATPVTDGTAMRALSLARSGFETLPEAEMDEAKLYEAVSAVVLAQYGISTPGTYRAPIVHAFAHGFSHDYEAHQGTVHGILAPHVLEYVFSEVDASRSLLAEALGVAEPGASDEEIRDDGVMDAAPEGVDPSTEASKPFSKPPGDRRRFDRIERIPKLTA